MSIRLRKVQVFEYQQYHRYFAQIADGTEGVAGDELSSLGATDVKAAYRGLHFNADASTLYRITYTARIPTRVFAPLVRFDCHSAKYLYRRVHELPWPELFSRRDTFAVHANVSNSAIRHSQYAALRVKDAIVDRFREREGHRPDVSTDDPDVRINLYINNNRATLSLETGAGSMHRRGYRQESVEAPMMEHVAAAVIRMTGWGGERLLYDPMCGSGTLLAEAVMHYCGIPSGYLRERFGVRFLPDFDAGLWDRVRREADAGIQELPEGLVAGSDADPVAVAAARANLGRLPGGRRVSVERRQFERIDGLESATIVCNPPWGKRLGRGAEAPDLIGRFGDFLKQRCRGSEAFVYFGRRELIKSVGLRTSWKRPLANGGLDGRLVRYELY